MLALGCSSILGIQEPGAEASAGEAGEPSEGGGPAAGSPAGGAAGAVAQAGAAAEGGTLAEGGSAGEGGSADLPDAGAAGSGGAPADPCPTKARCGGLQGKTPELCDAGIWSTNTSENSGADCAVACNAGSCGACKNGEKRCTGITPETCTAGAWLKGSDCLHDYCAAGECKSVTSCQNADLQCGVQKHSCCRAFEVPGGSFNRDNDGEYPATISSFVMDEFEVTVDRFAEFVSGYDTAEAHTHPVAGAGKSNHIAQDPGWQDSFTLPANADALRTMLKCGSADPSSDPTISWTNPDKSMPANCLSFYVAYAFCIWDGGRLPTEAEWDYAAAGGQLQRLYPWSTSSDPDQSTAAFAASSDRDGSLTPVGSFPTGVGAFGQQDLAGNVFEWTLDYFADPYASSACTDCIETSFAKSHSIRGGAFSSGSVELQTTSRLDLNSNLALSFVGFRCARDLPLSTN